MTRGGGCALNKRGGDRYVQEVLIAFSPRGTFEKEVIIGIPEGIEVGQQSTIDIVCTGSVSQKFVYN